MEKRAETGNTDKILSSLKTVCKNTTDAVGSQIAWSYRESYYRTWYEMQTEAGHYYTPPKLTQSQLNAYLNHHLEGMNWKDRLQGHYRKYASDIKQIIDNGRRNHISEDEIKNMILASTGTVGESGITYKIQRVLRTESNAATNDAALSVFKRLKIDEYYYNSQLDDRSCEPCDTLDMESHKRPFKIKEAKTGENYPPLHPNCVLPDTKIIAPDMEAITKSEYSGDVIEFRTANGRRLTVTPNHIVLTSEGWVRAKNLLKGDKIVYYGGNIRAEGHGIPADNDGIPFIEEFFASLVESGTVATVIMPVSPEYFKGDVAEDGEINVVLINSELRDKINTAIRELLGDVHLVWTPEGFEGELSRECSLTEFLMSTALATDGIMSRTDIPLILFSGALTHHEAVRFCLRTGYDSRLYKTRVNRCSGDTEQLRKGLLAGTGLIGFDDVISVNTKVYHGHVYDASSLSTLYIANSVITSNCRCWADPVMNDKARQVMEKKGEQRKKLSYRAWFREYVK